MTEEQTKAIRAAADRLGERAKYQGNLWMQGSTTRGEFEAEIKRAAAEFVESVIEID